ncbi:MAG TPA: lipoprotein [Candidatus Angelobacter sp.]|nr:lipoprotein [Candidatus Angelobacter sp.]
MKKVFIALGVAALLAGCASHNSDNGMGGTSDQYNQSSSSSQYNNNASDKAESQTTLTNSNTGSGMQQ